MLKQHFVTTDPRYFEACYNTQLQPFYLDFPLDAIDVDVICCLSTDLRVIPSGSFVETVNQGFLFLLFLRQSIFLIRKPQIGNISASFVTLRPCYSRALKKLLSRKMLKRVGDKRHHCLNPTVVLNHSSMLPSMWTALVVVSES